MSEKRDTSRLGEHIFEKKGIIATPLNHAMRDTLQLNSWSRDRLPEYLWLGLILRDSGRKAGFNILGGILKAISDLNLGIDRPKLSALLGLPEDQQKQVYQIILAHIDRRVLSPLTLIIAGDYPIFYETFLVSTMSVETRLRKLREACQTLYNHQSDEATDLRFLALSLMLMGGRLHFSKNTKNSIEAFREYPRTEHSDERMRMYRPAIRSMEGVDLPESNPEFSHRFWTEVGMIDECKPFYIEHEVNPSDIETFISSTRDVLDYTCASEKNLLLESHRFEVVVGSITYGLKILDEIHSGGLSNSILGRHGVRTIAEVYIMLKYLRKNEEQKPAIWSDYKRYGIGKLKLVLLKSREQITKKQTHFAEPIIDLLVNESVWEEFIDIDLKYFDQQNIREKSTEVGEKETYDVLYDYDTGFVHGFWGAVRESSMLACDNPTHNFHKIPDIYNQQKLSTASQDARELLAKMMGLLNEICPLADWYVSKYLAGGTQNAAPS